MNNLSYCEAITIIFVIGKQGACELVPTVETAIVKASPKSNQLGLMLLDAVQMK